VPLLFMSPELPEPVPDVSVPVPELPELLLPGVPELPPGVPEPVPEGAAPLEPPELLDPP
jgi:hypothetical protein